MPTYTIQHITHYQYPQYINYCANQIVLFPLQDKHQTIVQHTLKITKNPSVSVSVDCFGNQIGTFTILEPLDDLVIESIFTVITQPIIKESIQQTVAVQWQELFLKSNSLPFADFLDIESCKFIEEIDDYAQQKHIFNFTPLQVVKYIGQFIYKKFKYVKGVTTVDTNINDIWETKVGVCQDFTHVMLTLLRILKIPARYVSGYICPQHHELRGDGATHAWVEAYLPFIGWLGYDPTNNCWVNDKHVRLAIGRHYKDCSPVKGVFRGGVSEHLLEVKVSIRHENQLYYNETTEVFKEISVAYKKGQQEQQQQ